MRFLYVALFGLALTGASFLPNIHASSASSAVSSSQSASSLDSFFSSDAPQSLHEANTQGTLDEPSKTWPEANAWLHASLSDTEREFLTLTVTGTVSPSYPTNGGMPANEISDAGGTVAVTFYMNVAQFTQPLATQLQTDIISGTTGATSLSVSLPTFSSIQTGTTNAGASILETQIKFTFTYAAGTSTTAGSQFASFANNFALSTSTLRKTTSFQNIDLGYTPTFVFTTTTTGTPTTAPPTSAVTTSPPTTAASYCSAHPTACLNGGTCIDAGGGAYKCSCASGYIGLQCQFSLSFTSKRRKLGPNGVARGRTVTRPNVQAKSRAV
jgi:hypothetical protein